MITEKEVVVLMERVRAMITGGHYVYASGKHGSSYVNKKDLYPYHEETSLLCRAIAEHFVDYEINAVVGPAMGGIILSQWTAHHLNQLTNRLVFAVYGEKSENPTVKRFTFDYGYKKLIKGKKVLIVDDVVTTGESIKFLAEAVREAKAVPIAAGAIWNRGGVEAKEAGVDYLFSLANIKLESWPPKECPLCAAKIQINTDFGHGRMFLVAKNAFKAW